MGEIDWVVSIERHHVVERAFDTLKHRRGLATRIDKHTTNYRGAIVLAAILTRTRALKPRPRRLAGAATGCRPR